MEMDRGERYFQAEEIEPLYAVWSKPVIFTPPCPHLGHESQMGTYGHSGNIKQ